MRIVYLLRVEELKDKECLEHFLPFADRIRQEKVRRISSMAEKARSLGGGLLLRYGLDFWKASNGNPERGSREVFHGEGCRRQFLSLKEIEKALPFREEPFFYYGAGGKPYLRDQELFFSLSHSGDYAACAISQGEIGLDIQQVRQADTDRLAARFYPSREKDILQACSEESDRRLLFYQLWVQKESYGKLEGSGLPKALCVSPEAEKRSLGIGLEAWRFREDYVGCVCWNAQEDIEKNGGQGRC